MSAVAVLFAALGILFTPELSRVMDYPDHHLRYIWIVAVVIALDVITAIPYARLRQENKARLFVILRTFSVVLNVVLVVFLYEGLPRLAAGGGWWASLYDPSYGAGYLPGREPDYGFRDAAVAVPAYRDCVPRIRWRLLRTIFIYSFPLLVSGVAGVANRFIDRQMIEYLMPRGRRWTRWGSTGP
ncbi:MAG: hypothetical protein ACLR8Y_04810 [Alistipes indistinctus]